MNKIIIVEDEKMIRQGIEVMIKNTGLSYKSMLTFKNGLEAWEYIQEHSDIDLVITDVKMPKMNGVELVKRINKLKVRPYVLVVSGYSDFEYVVEMLRHKTVDYLLKPLNRDEFEKRLTEIHEMLYQKQDYNIKIQKILEKDLNDSLLSKEILSSSLGPFIYSHLKLSENTTYQIHCIHRYKNEADDFYLGNVDGNHYIMQFRNFNEEKKVYHSASQMDEALEAAYYDRVRNFYNAIKINYKNLYILKESQIFNILQNVFIHNQTTLSDTIREVIKKIEEGQYHPESLSKINKTVFKLLEQYYGYLDYQMVIGYYPKELFYFASIDEYLIALVNWENKMIKNFDVEMLKERSKINEAVNFINNNFSDDINMAFVSNYVSMNYSVFSQLFKEHVGVNFIDYLKNLRINKAIEYLENTDYFVKEISEKVGYVNYKYFAKLFKHEVGVSPSEYRKMKGK